MYPFLELQGVDRLLELYIKEGWTYDWNFFILLKPQSLKTLAVEEDLD